MGRVLEADRLDQKKLSSMMDMIYWDSHILPVIATSLQGKVGRGGLGARVIRGPTKVVLGTSNATDVPLRGSNAVRTTSRAKFLPVQSS